MNNTKKDLAVRRRAASKRSDSLKRSEIPITGSGPSLTIITPEC